MDISFITTKIYIYVNIFYSELFKQTKIHTYRNKFKMVRV